MTVTCENLEVFVKTVAALVREGICFEADTNNFVITLTGGY
jgi:hypothetical protein